MSSSNDVVGDGGDIDDMNKMTYCSYSSFSQTQCRMNSEGNRVCDTVKKKYRKCNGRQREEAASDENGNEIWVPAMSNDDVDLGIARGSHLRDFPDREWGGVIGPFIGIPPMIQAFMDLTGGLNDLQNAPPTSTNRNNSFDIFDETRGREDKNNMHPNPDVGDSFSRMFHALHHLHSQLDSLAQSSTRTDNEDNNSHPYFSPPNAGHEGHHLHSQPRFGSNPDDFFRAKQ